MTKPLAPMDDKLTPAEQAAYERFQDGLDDVKDHIYTLLSGIVDRPPEGSNDLRSALRAMIANDLGLLAEDIELDRLTFLNW